MLGGLPEGRRDPSNPPEGFALVLARGLEPPRVSPYGPEPYASANSATRAKAGRTMRVQRMTCKVKSSRLEWENSEWRWLNQPKRLFRARTSNWCALPT